jgi:hypothetical protein
MECFLPGRWVPEVMIASLLFDSLNQLTDTQLWDGSSGGATKHLRISMAKWDNSGREECSTV